MTRPLSAGLLLNFRDARRSIVCIESLLNEGMSPVLVWDNSADEGESAALIQARFADDKRVIVHVSAANLGFGTGVNRALALCKTLAGCQRVLLINNDAVLLPDALRKLGDALDAHATAKISFPMIEHAGKTLGPGFYHRLTGMQSWKPRPGSFSYPSGCCMLLELARIKLPLFDEDFFMYGEDCELGWRLHQHPGSIIHVPEKLVIHEGSASSSLGSAFYEARTVASHLLLARKLARNPADAFLLFSLRIPVLLLRATLRSFRFRSFVPWQALWPGARIASGKDPLRQTEGTR